jgi:hypothetical protein
MYHMARGCQEELRRQLNKTQVQENHPCKRLAATGQPTETVRRVLFLAQLSIDWVLACRRRRCKQKRRKIVAMDALAR